MQQFELEVRSLDRTDGGFTARVRTAVDFSLAREDEMGVSDVAVAANGPAGAQEHTVAVGDLLWSAVPEDEREEDGQCTPSGTAAEPATVRASRPPYYLVASGVDVREAGADREVLRALAYDGEVDRDQWPPDEVSADQYAEVDHSDLPWRE